MLKGQLQLGLGSTSSLPIIPPAAEVKGFLNYCQAKGPELVISEINTNLIFWHDLGKFQRQLEGYQEVTEELAPMF